MAELHSNVLLVEGAQDKFVIPELIEANGIDWGTKKDPIVYIRDCDGYSNLIDPDSIATELQGSGLSALGIIIDADENPDARWQSVIKAVSTSIPDIPTDLSENGLIHTTSDEIKFGIWMMPDNQMRGMLETFLAYLIPSDNEELWRFAQEAVQEAKRKGAELAEQKLDKANIYTWLAWQKSPGRRLHQAVMERILDPKHPNAQKFVTWFKTLYDLS
ncbi:MAG: DUF3226 domain-containing protein [Thainema sp.]